MNHTCSDRSIPHLELFLGSYCVSLHQGLNLWTSNLQKKNTGAGIENMTELRAYMMEPWGELRWAEYHFVNVPLEVFSLSCINLSILPAPVELGDAFVFTQLWPSLHSSSFSLLSLHLQQLSDWTTSSVQQLGTKQSNLTTIPMVLEVKQRFLYTFLLFIHTLIFVHRRVAVEWMTVLLAGNTKICETNTNKLFTFNSFAPWINTRSDSYIFTTKNSSFNFSSNLLMGKNVLLLTATANFTCGHQKK